MGRYYLIAIFLPVALLAVATTMPSMSRREAMVTLGLLAVLGIGVGLYATGSLEQLYWTGYATTVPAEQSAFVGLIEARRAAGLAFDDEQARSFCAGSAPVADWQGDVRQILLTNGGRAVFTIKVSPHVLLGTSTNLQSNTLIGSASELIAVIGALSANQKVWFSGRFVPAGGRCVVEQGEAGSGREADLLFVFAFTRIATSPQAAPAGR